MSHGHLSRLAGLAAALGVTTAALTLAAPAGAATPPFTPGNLVVYRVGTGTDALTSSATPVLLDEFTRTGTLVRSIQLPTAASGSQRALTASGTATSEGLLSRSTDRRYLVLTGYNASPGTASVASTSATVANRVVGRVADDGTVDTSTALSDAALDGNNVRSAASIDGRSFWVTGAAGSVRYATLGASASTQLSTTVTNLRQTSIFANQLYVSTSSGTAVRVGTVGSGTPMTSGQTISNLPGFPTTGSPYAFRFLDVDGNGAIDTLYVADDSAGQIQKYVLSGGTWVAMGAIAVPLVRGLTATVAAGVVSLYATNGSSLFGATDASGLGGALGGAAVTLATAPANEAFRGVAFAPDALPPPPAVPEAPWAALLPMGAMAVLGTTAFMRRRNAA